jgi:quercetin dioxygenase-like cupin family protein
MQVLSRLERDHQDITNYASHGASSARLLDGSGEAHAYILQFDAGGAIGRHEAGFGQLLVVLAGRGWASGDDGIRVEVEVGDVVYFERGEHHSKGSDDGMTALMVQVRDLVHPSSAIDQ